MELAEKMKETALSVLPISAMVVALGLGVARLPGALLARFCLGSALVVVGLTLFLLGVEVGVSRLGERCGTALMERRSLSLMAGAAFVIGLVVTVAEPDIQVFASQVNGVFPELGRMAVIGAIALGVGAFLALGVARSVTGISLKWALAALYFVALGMMALVPGRFAGVAFDSGGATTGPFDGAFHPCARAGRFRSAARPRRRLRAYGDRLHRAADCHAGAMCEGSAVPPPQDDHGHGRDGGGGGRVGDGV